MYGNVPYQTLPTKFIFSLLPFSCLCYLASPYVKHFIPVIYVIKLIIRNVMNQQTFNQSLSEVIDFFCSLSSTRIIEMNGVTIDEFALNRDKLKDLKGNLSHDYAMAVGNMDEIMKNYLENLLNKLNKVIILKC
jgi:hypothetical protein